MDRRLFEAAQTGNIKQLHHLLLENPLALHYVSLASTQNPLHVASIVGHVDFLKEILRLKPDFSKEVNAEGFSPMPMASANGHLEIVKELLKVDRNLCLLAGRDRKTPLHCAAIKGRVDVIAEMLLACPVCIEDATIHRETALHLAVKHSQFETVGVLVELIRKVKKKDIMNVTDTQGNTVLHLASWKKQRQVIGLLLGNEALTTGLAPEVNAINHSGLTALDLLIVFPSEAGDREIEEILRGAGAIRARDSHNILTPAASSEPVNQTPETGLTEPRTSVLSPRELVEYFMFKMGRDSPNDARNAILVQAVLVTTATYQVGVTPPEALRSRPYYYLVFMISNCLGFCSSGFIINVLTANFPLYWELQFCLFMLGLTYGTAVISDAPDAARPHLQIVFISFIVLGYLLFGVRRIVWFCTKQRRQS